MRARGSPPPHANGAACASAWVRVCVVEGRSVVEHSHMPTLTRVLAMGADPNARDAAGVTPVWWCARFGTAAALRALVAAGGDVNAQVRRADAQASTFVHA